jgi:hypothetical protein
MAREFGALERTISVIMAMEHRYSLYFALDVFGYGLLGLGLAVVTSALWGRSRLWNLATVATFACGVGSLGGPIGILLDNETVTRATVLGGIFAMVSSGLTAAAFRQQSRRLGASGASKGRMLSTAGANG